MNQPKKTKVNSFNITVSQLFPFQKYQIQKPQIIIKSNYNIEMKQQYASNCDDPIFANQRLKNKLEFLQRQSAKRQVYLKQLQRNLKVSKQTIKSLMQKNPSQKQISRQLQQENTHLMENLKDQYVNVCRLNVLYLMECQLRVQQSKSYNQRILDFEANMAELRRYLHDKEESFSFVAEKLKKIEQLLPNQQVAMYERLVSYSGVVKQGLQWKDVIRQLQVDREAWRKLTKRERQKNLKLQVLINGMKIYHTFEQFQYLVHNLDTQQVIKLSARLGNANNQNFNNQNVNNQNNLVSIPTEPKNQTNLSTSLSYSQSKQVPMQPNIQLIRLMKKQKLNNKILESALEQAIQKNIQLIQYNKRLIQSNEGLRQEVDGIVADMVVLCSVMQKHDQNYRTKVRMLRHRAKCDLDMPSYREIIQKYKQNDLEQANYILFTKMRTDVQQLTQYVALCPLQKTNNIRSFESPPKITHECINTQVPINQDQNQYQVSQI